MSAEENRRRMEANRRRFEEDSRRRQRTSSSSLYRPPSLLEQVSPPPASSSGLSDESSLIPTPEQIRFTAAYGSREPFSSPLTSGGFTEPYASRQPFSSPQPPFNPLNQPNDKVLDLTNRSRQTRGVGAQTSPQSSNNPLNQPNDRVIDLTNRSTQHTSNVSTSRQTSGSYRTNLSDRFSSALTSDTGAFEQTQTEPSVRPKVRVPPPIPSRSSSLLPSGGSSSGSYSIISRPLYSGRSQSTGDLSQQFSSSLTLGSQQTEPSVRPKVRTGPEPLFRENTNRETDIVKRYRNPLTGRPDFSQDRGLRFGRGRAIPLSDDSRERGLQLANMSREQIRDITAYDRNLEARQTGYLQRRGFEREYYADQDMERFRPRVQSDNLPKSSIPPFLPSRSEDMARMNDPRFNKPVSDMDSKMVSTIGPLGHQGYGPLRRRAMSCPDLSRTRRESIPTDLQLFGHRYLRMDDEDRGIYNEYRQQINWDENPYARSRMVKAPTAGRIGVVDKKRLGQIKKERNMRSRQFADQSAGQTFRARKMQYIKKVATLPKSIPDKTFVIGSIPEEEDEDEDEDD